MGRRKRAKTLFEESLQMNNRTYIQYVERLTELAISRFKWNNLPDSVDPRYLELTLFMEGSAIYFNDEELGNLALACITQGNFNVYGEPYARRAYSRYNNYNRELYAHNSVIIWNNYMRTNNALDVQMFSRRLYNIDRIIDINVNGQKTPILIQGNEKQRLTLVNLYKEYDGNVPVIYGDETLNIDSLTVLKTDAPYISDKLYELKTQIWNEALTYLGISNVSAQKKERMITDEVIRNQGGTIASRYSALESRIHAAEKINRMFGTDISVEYREYSENDEIIEPEDGDQVE